MFEKIIGSSEESTHLSGEESLHANGLVDFTLFNLLNIMV